MNSQADSNTNYSNELPRPQLGVECVTVWRSLQTTSACRQISDLHFYNTNNI